MTADLHALWRERQRAIDAFESTDDLKHWHAYLDAEEMIRAAKPTDLAGLAVQARLLADEVAADFVELNIELAEEIAERLEEIGKNAG